MWKKKTAPTMVVAEIGVNHNGSVELAHRLCEEAKKANADAVKFQTFTAELLVTDSTRRAPYQLRQGDSSQLEMLKQLEISNDIFEDLVAHCNELELQCFSTPYDEKSAEFLASVGVPMLKIASADIVNRPLLEAASDTGLPIVQSTGMATMSEVARAVELFRARGVDNLSLLHCVTSYPLDPEQVNLQWMNALFEAFQVQVGYSDHTADITVPLAAVALGATMIEKHFTVGKSLEGPDHAASLEPEEFARMVIGIRQVEQAIGQTPFGQADSELVNMFHMRRSLHASRAINIGDTIEPDDLVSLRPAEGIDPWHKDLVVGRIVRKQLNAGDPVKWESI